jgi:DNA-binding CsgD family transcriptional regulator
MKVPQRYQGYLKPHLTRIVALLEEGKTPIQIGRILLEERVVTHSGNWYISPAGAIASSISGIFYRERINIKQPHPINRWNDLLPKHIAKQQYKWERATMIRRGKLAGLTNVEISRHLKTNSSSVSNLLRWLDSRKSASPIEQYINAHLHMRPFCTRDDKAKPAN